MSKLNTYGRKVIYANYTEKELLSGSQKDVENKVLDILTNSISLHEQNHSDCIYLKKYLYGDQDIYRDKQKLTRTEIDNKTVENWAYAIIDFKKAYLLGKAIQYVQLDDSSEEEISVLNKYVRYENKQAKDLMIYEDVLACGRGFRYVNIDTIDENAEDDEAPFELINAPVEDTEVVYSSKLGNEQLLSYIKTSMMFIDTQINPKTGEKEPYEKYYSEYTIYLRDRMFVINDKSGQLQVVKGSYKPIMLGKHLITEYFTNVKRISLIELGKDLFNDINYLESMDKDDMEQFVNAIMVFTNAEIDEEGLNEMKSLGAVCINSTDNKKASIDLLQGRLNATDTQTYYNRLLTSLHQILGVPMASDSGTVTSGDTGKAKLTGQGFTTAGIRAEAEECMFGMCDMESLKVILKACKKSTQSDIKKLKASDIDKKFQRDMSDNLLIKAQALQNLYNCDIPRKFANSVIGLFGDPNSVTKEQERIFGEQGSKQNSNEENSDSFNDDNSNKNQFNNDDTKNTNKDNITQAQTNNVQDTLEKQNQGN